MTAWLELVPAAFDSKARPVADALFSRAEAMGVDGALFDASGEPVAGALIDVEVAPDVNAEPVASRGAPTPVTPITTRKSMDVKIKSIGATTTAAVPFSQEWIKVARGLSGVFRTGVWHFDARDAERVKELAREIFGTDGNAADAADLVDVRIRLEDYESVSCALFAGRTIAERTARDSEVKLARGVVVVEGRLSGRGGSVKTPRIEADGVFVEVRDFPRAALSIVTEPYTIVRGTVDVAALQAEREKLLARLAELDALIAGATS